MQLKKLAVLVPLLVARAAHGQDYPTLPPDPPPAPDPAPAPEPTTTPAPTPTDDDGDDLGDADLGTGDYSPDDPTVEDTDTSTPSTGDARLGIYSDSDHTQVIRTLAEIAHVWAPWSLNVSVGVDAVTSASIDVRTSPLGTPDTVTSASGRSSTSPGQMTDRRLQASLGGGHDDGSGHVLSGSATVAAERDYQSMSGDLNGSWDILDRTTTLLGGLTYTDNWVSSVLDQNLHERMHAYGWSAGISHVLTRNDALRLRYDGADAEGFQSSPYRNVRFGDWTATTGSGGQMTFSNTIGSADGLPEKLPGHRLSSAIVLELVHALGASVALHPSVRLAHESWGIDSFTGSLDLRVARTGWRLDLGYRYYTQTAADFFQGKYTSDPSMYTYYTSDKELGTEHDHTVTLDIAGVLHEPEDDHQDRLLLDARFAAMQYTYPGFALLDGRTGVFAQIGLTWEH